jgi:hypothetical protein
MTCTSSLPHLWQPGTQKFCRIAGIESQLMAYSSFKNNQSDAGVAINILCQDIFDGRVLSA